MVQIPKYLLILVYLIVPISLLLVLSDIFVFGRSLQRILPRSPEDLLAFVIVFRWPHVIASSFGFLDSGYIAHYRKQLVVPCLMMVLGAVFLPFILGYGAHFLYFQTTLGHRMFEEHFNKVGDYPILKIGLFLFSFIFEFWTVKHLIGQQFGLTRMMTKAQGVSFSFWSYLGSVIWILLYFQIFRTLPLLRERREYVNLIILILSLPFTLLTLKIHRSCKDGMGAIFLWSNYFLIVVEWIFFFLNYPFFFILAPRVIHDVTAFIFYGNHDENRNSTKMHNILYRPFQRMQVPLRFLSPILAVILAFPITYFTYVKSWLALLLYLPVTILGMFHYYTDGFSWKQGSLRRKYIVLR